MKLCIIDMFKTPLSQKQIELFTLSKVDEIDKSIYDESNSWQNKKLKQAHRACETLHDLSKKYLEYRLGGPIPLETLKSLVEQIKSELGIKLGQEMAKEVTEIVDEKINGALKGSREH